MRQKERRFSGIDQWYRDPENTRKKYQVFIFLQYGYSMASRSRILNEFTKEGFYEQRIFSLQRGALTMFCWGFAKKLPCLLVLQDASGLELAGIRVSAGSHLGCPPVHSPAESART